MVSHSFSFFFFFDLPKKWNCQWTMAAYIIYPHALGTSCCIVLLLMSLHITIWIHLQCSYIQNKHTKTIKQKKTLHYVPKPLSDILRHKWLGTSKKQLYVNGFWICESEVWKVKKKKEKKKRKSPHKGLTKTHIKIALSKRALLRLKLGRVERSPFMHNSSNQHHCSLIITRQPNVMWCHS